MLSSLGSLRDLAVTATLLLTISTIWVESDTYRIVCGLMVLGALAYYVRFDITNPDRIRIGWPGFVCLGWAIYVAIRYALAAGEADSWHIGSLEGVYLFPLIFPTLGYAIYLLTPKSGPLLSGFVIISFAVMAINIDSIYTNHFGVTDTLFFGNSLFTALSIGMMCFVLAFIFLYSADDSHLLASGSRLSRGLIIITLALGAANLIMLNSKGIWLSGVLTLPVFFWAVRDRIRWTRKAIVAMAGIALVGAVGLWAAQDRIVAVGGPTALALTELAGDAADDGNVMGALRDAIDDPGMPMSAGYRVMLIVDSLTMIAERPLIGHGPGWMTGWAEREYQNHEFDHMHSAYLEVLVRYGLFGLAVYGFMMGWSVYQMHRASREGLASPAFSGCGLVLIVFFLLCVATNSHNRFAVGEAFMMMFVAAGFYSYYLRQAAGIVRPRTWL